MKLLNLSGTPAEIMAALCDLWSEVGGATTRARSRIMESKREVAWHEANTLAYLAHCRDVPGAHFLEIGTAYGFTAACMAEAAPNAQITTLNPKAKEHSYAVGALSIYPNVTPVCALSWDYLATYAGPPLALVFVDGDHGMVVKDLPWWNHLQERGLMLFHDYCPPGSGRPCQPVYETAQAFGEALGRAPDVLIDSEGVGMAGWVRRNGEMCPQLDEAAHSWHLGWVRGA